LVNQNITAHALLLAKKVDQEKSQKLLNDFASKVEDWGIGMDILEIMMNTKVGFEYYEFKK